MKNDMDTQIVRHSATEQQIRGSNACLSPPRVRHQDQTEDCQCDICRSQDVGETNHVIPLPDETNAMASQPEAEAGQEKT